MKKLLLLRHAKSRGRASGLTDFDRSLKDKGRQAAALIGSHLQATGCVPDAIIASPALRARETAECIIGAIDGAGTSGTVPALSFERRLYEAPTGAILQTARAAGGNPAILMLVGHNPSMHLAALNFCGDGDAAMQAELLRSYPTAALASFDFEKTSWRDISWSDAIPVAFVSPKRLRGGYSVP